MDLARFAAPIFCCTRAHTDLLPWWLATHPVLAIGYSVHANQWDQDYHVYKWSEVTFMSWPLQPLACWQLCSFVFYTVEYEQRLKCKSNCSTNINTFHNTLVLYFCFYTIVYSQQRLLCARQNNSAPTSFFA
jgi:hypothetical protein